MSDSYLYRSLEAYIRKHYIEEEKLLFRECCFMTEPEEDTEEPAVTENACSDIWPEFIPRPDKNTFSSKLFHLIEQKGLEDVEVYKKANIDRKLFPSCAKTTIIQARKQLSHWRLLYSSI